MEYLKSQMYVSYQSPKLRPLYIISCFLGCVSFINIHFWILTYACVSAFPSVLSARNLFAEFGTMDATSEGLGPATMIQFHAISDQEPHLQVVHSHHRHCYGNTSHGEFPLSSNPSIVLHVLTESELNPQDLARLEASCKFFRQPACFAPDHELSISELAALDMCQRRVVFKQMTQLEKDMFKDRCGGSWKLVLRFLMIGESCYRREQCQAIAGPGHSLVVTKTGAVFTFGNNEFGQLGQGFTEENEEATRHEWRPKPIRSLQGIRIIQAAAGAGRSMLISDTGSVYAFGKDSFGDAEYAHEGPKTASSPKLVESLKGIYAVQAAIGNFFTAVLSREGRVYTFSWGADATLGHQTEPQDYEPHLLKGDLENVPVVQIAAGYCYLLALGCQPNGMSVYSVGCGLGGKLGHGTRTDEKYPKMIEQFSQIDLDPVVIAAGAWHAAVVGKDGRVCTWGWGRYGCLGHGNEECETVPKVVESLVGIKAVHVTTGDYTTFVVADNGDVYSFGCGESSSLGHLGSATEGQRHTNVLKPELVASLKQKQERIVQISLTNSIFWNAHTFALTETGKLYAFGAGDKGQLGTALVASQSERGTPELVDIDLN